MLSCPLWLPCPLSSSKYPIQETFLAQRDLGFILYNRCFWWMLCLRWIIARNRRRVWVARLAYCRGASFNPMQPKWLATHRTCFGKSACLQHGRSLVLESQVHPSAGARRADGSKVGKSYLGINLRKRAWWWSLSKHFRRWNQGNVTDRFQEWKDCLNPSTAGRQQKSKVKSCLKDSYLQLP